ncbi:MAG TPA: YccF domain-containing protein [Caulobacteraceae bacterium]|nr:YccF domain-containing protein [Caulobacteraceae bacterium]
MTLFLNVLWFVFGGFVSGLAWLTGALAMALSLVGIPWVPATLRIGVFSLAPFGLRVANRRAVTRRDDLGSGSFGCLLNVVWFVFAGWYIALAHLVIGTLLCVTILGIPFGLQHFKLAGIALAPVGKEIVPA